VLHASSRHNSDPTAMVYGLGKTRPGHSAIWLKNRHAEETVGTSAARVSGLLIVYKVLVNGFSLDLFSKETLLK
jgi:hypothetical protein